MPIELLWSQKSIAGVEPKESLTAWAACSSRRRPSLRPLLHRPLPIELPSLGAGFREQRLCRLRSPLSSALVTKILTPPQPAPVMDIARGLLPPGMERVVVDPGETAAHRHRRAPGLDPRRNGDDYPMTSLS